MKRMKSLDDLAAWREALASRPAPEVCLRVCSTGCRALGALEVCEVMETEIAARGLADRVRVVRTGCHGLCAGAVAVVIDPKDIFYQGVTAADVPEIVERTVLGGKVVKRLCWSAEGRTVTRRKNIPFYKHQTRRVLKNCGVVDPKSLQDAVAHGAYASAALVLSARRPQDVIDEVIRSGLRGRGGAGFPTGRKWQLARASPGKPKYVICNADEGDPGAFMDRAILEGDPHLVLEGMLIGAYAIGAARGVIYVRAEYPIAIEHTKLALEQAREAGLLGSDLLGTGFDFDIEIRQGAGAFVCGEETALIASVEGRRGMPRPRPPFPAARRGPTSPGSSNSGPRSTRASARKARRAPRSSPSPARSSRRGSWKCRWARRCGRLFSTSAAASRVDASSRPRRWAARPADASPHGTSTSRLTTTPSAKSAPSWAPAA
jgi:NADH-quinone oxidoreductase subunit F/NADP-reducing hydrogenase subunit HndC